MKVQFRSILTTNPKMRPLLVSSFIAAVLMTASSSSSRASSPSLLEMELAERMAEEEAAKAFAGDNDRLGISTDVTETYFLLFTLATGADSPVEVPRDLSSAQAETALEGAGFDPAKKTFFLIHGFWSGESFADEFVGDLLTHGDYNVFGVEWPTLAQFPFFLRAGENAVKVGEYAGEFLGDLVALTGLDPGQVHLVGHSYGSQAAGQMGRSARALTGGVPVGRVTALEPAFPWFRWHDASLVVGAGDAEFVDVWHTNSGKLAEACLSFPEPLGDVDFYPAGGSHQPGCTELCTRRGCTENDFLELLGGGCSHGRSKDYFIESINGLDRRFAATSCGSYGDFRAGLCQGREEAEMGLMLDTERVTRGTYFLDVDEQSPYALG